MTTTTIGLLRHGQTDWNIGLRLQGITDIPLNETGLAQAKLAAQFLTPGDWDFVSSSPLSRALITAQTVAEHIGIPEVQIEPLLLERSFGEAEGLTHAQWKAAYPDGKPPAGETLDELRFRANSLLETLLTRYRGTRVLAVSHGAMIRKLVRIVSAGELPREGERLENTSLCILINDQSGWSVKRYDPRSLGN